MYYKPEVPHRTKADAIKFACEVSDFLADRTEKPKTLELTKEDREQEVLNKIFARQCELMDTAKIVYAKQAFFDRLHTCPTPEEYERKQKAFFDGQMKSIYGDNYKFGQANRTFD